MTLNPDEVLRLRNVSKTFTLHERDVSRCVLSDISLSVRAGECVHLDGPSGVGKSTLMRMIYGTYKTMTGEILVHTESGAVDVVTADPWTLIELRRSTVGYVSQFLRVLPRVSAFDIVLYPLLLRGIDRDKARATAASMLSRLDIAERLWDLSPLTFSGGEQQRVNIARGFAPDHKLLLLDEPTASLDAANRHLVLEVIRDALRRGVAIVAIFHDREIAQQVVTRQVLLADASLADASLASAALASESVAAASS
jgi:alpha-D-ribose 1-methylphosphonate 5-triphosphate synthase subunit PhnL